MAENNLEQQLESIAIIGMAGRFPKAQNITEFWQNVRDGVDGVTTFSDTELELSVSDQEVIKDNPNYIKKGAVVEGADLFDASFFGLLPKEVELMDPQHRLFLECSWQALEDAGYDPHRYAGVIGVFAGCYMNTYLLANLESNPDFIAGLANSFHGGSLQTELGNDKDYFATRVAYKLNLTGPSITMQTACSSSLVAITQACQNLLTYQCDMALAGGATLRFPQKRGYLYTEGGMVSPHGQCRTFDAQAKGTIFGNGVGVIMLKRLRNAIEDGDSIYAVIKGWGINNDGGLKFSYTAPSVNGQSEAIALAHALAGITADSIGYIEAHGTGTTLGDPIEIEALTRAFRATTDQKQFCAIGSAKTNIGHLDVAAGVTGVIKTALSLHHEQIPPSLHFDTPNPKIDFPNTPFFVNTELRPWPRTEQRPRRAGISSFGVGGTNAHVVVEEAPMRQQVPINRPTYLLPLSAKSEQALAEMSTNLAHYLQENPTLSLADVAFTLQQGRVEFNHRRFICAADTSAAIQGLTNTNAKNYQRTSQRNAPVVFMFPGQGAQHVNMGRELYQTEPLFKAAIDQCAQILQPHLGFDLRDALYPTAENTAAAEQEINQTYIAQPGIFAISYALASLWLSWGIEPQALIGHSIGEFVAACLAGAFSLEDALKIVAARAQLMQDLPAGSMLAIRLPEEEVRKILPQKIDIAVVNSVNLCVVSGPTEAIKTFQTQLEEQNITARFLHTSHAFHSWMMAPAVESFLAEVQAIALHAPQRPILSTVTAAWLTEKQATDPHYWANHLLETVYFAPAVQALLEEEAYQFIEIGPGQTLTTLTKQNPAKSTAHVVVSSLPHAQQSSSAAEHITQTLGQLWLAGQQINWPSLYGPHQPQRVHLPTYPFQRKRYWVQPAVSTDSNQTNGNQINGNGQTAVETPAPATTPAPAPPTALPAAATIQSQTKMQRLVQHQLMLMSQQLELLQKQKRNFQD